MDVILVASEPGEVYSLARPAIRALQAELPAADAWVFLSPGLNASGRECRIAASFEGVRRAVGPAQFLVYLASGIKPRGFAPSQSGVVVHLGGSTMFSTDLGRRLNYPVVIYANKSMACPKSASRFLVEDERIQGSLIARGASAEKVKPIGNLVVDSVDSTLTRDAARERLGIDGERIVSLFPGTHPREVAQMAPFLFRVAELLTKVERGIKFILPLSPFVGTASLEAMFGDPRRAGGPELSSASVEKGAGPIEAVTSGGVRIVIETSLREEAMAASDMAICTPSIVSMELAAMGIPHLVTAPIEAPGAVPLTGPMGLLATLPFVGEILRKRAYDLIRSSSKYFAMPNSKSGRTIVPEVVGKIKPEDVVIPAVELIGDAARLDRTGRELREIMGAPGAAGRLVQQIRSVLLDEQRSGQA